MTAQSSKWSNSKNGSNGFATEKRMENYMKLKNLGYQDHEIFEDLGNANFLSKNYETAAYWYGRLESTSKRKSLGKSHQKRYDYALQQANSKTSATASNEKDWTASVKSDYLVQNRSERYKDFEIQSNGELLTDNDLLAKQAYEALVGRKKSGQNGYEAPIAVTADGSTAYFSKTVEQKPEYGIFSKKEKLQKIFRASRVNGKWTNVKQVAVCPKYASAMHPTVSEDGKRLFFASNMPGSYGAYDIYVASIGSNGQVGTAKNLGEKVNTRKNDLYPNLAAGNTLFFASEGRDGFGGLDVYMAQVGHKSVAWSANLGKDINSNGDDFSVVLQKGNRKGYVMSNRSGSKTNTVERVAFSIQRKDRTREYKVLEALNNEEQIDYSSTVFEDE